MATWSIRTPLLWYIDRQRRGMRTARLTHVLSVCLLCVCVCVPLLCACVVCIRPASSQALRSGQDLFIVAASDLFGKPQSAVTADDRGVAKRAIYGILYGLGVYELAERLGVDVASASAFRNNLKQTYSGLEAYMVQVRERCRVDGYITTLFERRRYLPLIKSSDGEERAAAERQAVNSTVQGSAADLIKVAMSNIRARLNALPPIVGATAASQVVGGSDDGSGRHWQLSNLPEVPLPPARMLLQIHDELVFEVRIEHACAHPGCKAQLCRVAVCVTPRRCGCDKVWLLRSPVRCTALC